MLHLFARIEVVPPFGNLGFLSDAVSATRRGQGRVRDIDAAADKLFLHADQVALASMIEVANLVQVRFCHLFALDIGYLV